jgi:pimeloyl-ACP methyl ester carboxylesterase
MAPKGRPAQVIVDGVGLAYDEHGQGRPLVLVHGLASCSASWHETASLLSRGFRCIAVDLMGFGRSDKPLGESYTLRRQAELLQLFLVELALEDAVLIGHSYGGGVCLSALRHPRPRVSALVLVDSICYPQSAPLSFRLLGFPVLGPLALYLVPKSWVTGTVFGNAYGRRAAPAQELVAANALALASASGRHALIQTVRELMARPIEPLADYSRFSLPTLIVWGRRDRLVPIALGQRLASEVPGVQFVAFDKCGHLPQEESPRETAEVIARFVGAMPSGPTGSCG